MKNGLLVALFVLLISGCGSSNSQTLNPNSQSNVNSQSSSSSSSDSSSNSSSSSSSGSKNSYLATKEAANKIYEASQKTVNNIDNNTLKNSINYYKSKSHMPQQIPHIPKPPKLP